ncbi:MAG: 50S ribosomal protein L15 [Acholeplasmataceae bacterium]|jgi:large subunit ribosomal protein L15|nr:50S ribosomal protein L15 [Acholeplasmataceae bacterium]
MLKDLKPNEGARKPRRRVGRGTGSGMGKTSGRGHKGQLARAGRKPSPVFEGGQIPLFQRLPKRGFTNINKKEFAIVNLGDLNTFNDGDVITPDVLLEKRIIRKLKSGVKVLANGTLEKKITIKAHSFSQQALDQINQVGAIAEVI